uniref:7TM GPCR serpentine receptor class x (Srx) domain-containing protein n=1 Tax=Acrobeloides nanus TaxID=290746 RepID=A0A914C219_9BILA
MPQKNSKKEINILIQSVIIIFAFELEDWTYYAIAWFGDPGGDATYFIAFAQTWAGLLLNTIHAIIIFLFTSLAKMKLREIFGMKHGVNEISQTQFAKSNQGQLMRAKSKPVAVLPSMRSVVLKATSNQTRF